jgi:hypothetical protein
MYRRNSIAAGGALLALAMAIATGGCGSSGATADDSSATLTKAQYLKRAEHPCKLGINEITSYYGLWENKHTVNGKRPPEAARDKALSEVALAVHAKQLEGLKEIGLPREGQATVEKIYAAWEEGIENGEDDLSSMQASNEAFAFHKAYKWSIQFGLSSCWLG